MEFSIIGVVAIWMCQLQNQMSNEKAEIHDCMQAGVGWEEKGFTVRSLRSKTKILWKKKMTWRFPCKIQQTSVKVFQNSCADFAQGKSNCSVPPEHKDAFQPCRFERSQDLYQCLWFYVSFKTTPLHRSGAKCMRTDILKTPDIQAIQD